MISTGVRTQIAVKLFAVNLKDGEGKALGVQEALKVLEGKAVEVERGVRAGAALQPHGGSGAQAGAQARRQHRGGAG